ncbi:YdgA family protein [Chitinibacter bivalviorum]|uniref:YdgA family protein n=1 Tax=Chitinibacter bivalviorum TaxID=2739434 RepID=A0A7H9BDU5_9NEIS|nr:YdgA family protein [Chitinibacter bivalviorum]QLG86880.1 YdgA family protein [Chitinibacter bivalviorum]
MKRKVIAGSALGLVVLATGYLGGSYYAGQAVEQTMLKQHDWISKLPYFIVKSHSYQRGWLSSTETTTLQVNPEIYRFLVEKEGEPLQMFEVTYTNHIQHGPFPLLNRLNPIPYKAVVSTEFNYSADTQKFLAKFFGEQKPIHIENRISFNDDGVMKISVPSFDYEEALSGVKAKWQGLEATLDYGGDFKRVKFDATAPGLSGEAKSKGAFHLKDFSVSMDHREGINGLMIGTTGAKVTNFDLNLLENTPIKLSLENLTYQGKVEEKGDFINGSAQIDLAKLILDGKPYGPAIMIAEANHLHGKTLAKLGDEVTVLQKQKLNREQLTTALTKLAKEHGLPLLQNDPEFAIKKLEVKLPDGAIKFSGSVGLKGFVEADLEKPVDLVNKLDAKADFAIPRKVVETLVMWQARNMFSGGANDGQVNHDDIDFLAGQFVEGQINKLADQNLIRVNGDLLSAKASLKGGKFILNDIAVPLPWDQPAPAQ